MIDTSTIQTACDDPLRSRSSVRTMRVAPMLGIEALLGRFGLALAPLLADVGLPPESFHDPDNRLPVGRLVQLATRCAEQSGCPHFGLLLAGPVQLPALGEPLARLLTGAMSVERALRGLVMSLHLNGEAVVPALTIGADDACFSITPYDLHACGTEQLDDFVLAFASNILRFLCGPRWMPLRVTFARREPADRRPYETFFKVPLDFGAPINSLVFDRCWLTRRPAPLAPGQAFLARPPTIPDLDIATQARRAIIRGMAQGIVGVDSVASSLGLSKRTLNRRLAEGGTSTKDLIAGVRLQIAQQLMHDTDLSIADIAATLCYSDVAAFSRAFSAKVGKSPAAWRNRFRQ